MKVAAALEEVERLSVALNGATGEFRYRIHSPAAPYKEWFRTWPSTLFGGAGVSSPEVVSHYGVYLLATPDGDIVYIGKAARSVESDGDPRYHLGAEICAKFPAPTVVDGVPIFDADWVNKETPPEVQEPLRTGNILVTAIVIEPWQLAACVEAYLQAAAVLKDGELPPANVRIG